MEQFQAKIEKNEKGGAYVIIPFDIEEKYAKKRLKVKATFDGEPYRGSISKYGTPFYFLIVLKDIRAKINKDVGDIITVTFQEDTEPRIVEIPKDVELLFNENQEAKDIYLKLSYTHKKEYIQWINQAKKETTRERRKLKMIEMLLSKKK